MREEILEAFSNEQNIQLAYNTVRYFTPSEMTESPS